MQKLFSFLAVLFALFSVATPVKAQAPDASMYSTGVVLSIDQQTEYVHGDVTQYVQKVSLKNDTTGIVTQVTVGSEQIPVSKEQLYSVGQRVVVVDQDTFEGLKETVIADQYRLPALIGLAVVFILIVVVV